MNNKLPKLIVILGPTASGKTGLAIKLAKKFNGEIVSADSKQVYKEMAIGTAQPTKKEMKAVAHHLVGIAYPNEDFNVAVYKKIAIKVIKDILKRKKLPFLVGGTGLYIKAIVDNIVFPKIPPKKRIRKELEAKTKEKLFRIYEKLDPKGAKLIDKNNKRRLIRAIEVCKITKKSFWEQRKKQNPIFDVLQIGIKLPKVELEKRISKRTEKMFKLGLEKEVKNLIKKYGPAPLLQTIGYKEWLDSKEDKQKIKEEIKLHTLQFTKKQMTWFRKDKKIIWVRNYKKIENLVKTFI